MNRTESAPRISMVNVWSDHNRGDAAIVFATLDMIRRVHPQARVHLHNVVFGPNDLEAAGHLHFSEFSRAGLAVLPALFPALIQRNGAARYSRSARLISALRAILALMLARVSPRLARYLFSRRERVAYNCLIRSDLIISKGGSYLLANYWKDVLQLLMVFFPLILGRLAGRRTVLLGVSVGPARSAIAARFLRLCLRTTDLIVVREQLAFDTCLRLKVPVEKLILLPDTALFPIACETERPAIPAWLRDRPRPLVGVTVRLWSFDDVGNGAKRQAAYLEAVAGALREFQSKTGGTILLVPQVVGPNREGSDLEALDRLQALMAGCPCVEKFPATLRVEDLRAIYRHIDLLVGTRLHSILLAFGTPSVIIGYQGDKSLGTAQLLGCTDRFVHINEVTKQRLDTLLAATWEQRADIRRDLETRRHELRTRFERELPLIFNVAAPAKVPPRQALRWVARPEVLRRAWSSEGPENSQRQNSPRPSNTLCVPPVRKAPRLPTSRRRRAALLAACLMIAILSGYVFRFASLRGEIKNEVSHRSEFIVGSVHGPLQEYYLEPPLAADEVGKDIALTLSNGKTIAAHPDLIATRALQHYSLWKRSDDPAIQKISKQTFFALSEQLQSLIVPTRDSHGREFMVLEYMFENPWYPFAGSPWRSGLAQGRALSVLARHFQERPSARIEQMMDGIVASFAVPIGEGGILSNRDGNWFFEEVAHSPATHILNGHIIALWGLQDVLRVREEVQCRDYFTRGLDAISTTLPEYDSFPWSTYDLGPNIWAGTARPKYHILHARQLAILYEMTGRDEYLEYSRKWEAELDRVGDQVTFLFSRDYYRIARVVKTAWLY